VSAERVWYNSDVNVVADLQHVRSLDAMSRALRASRSSAQTLVEIRTSVVRDMLNARYYDSTRGQFLSQDPIFLSSSQNLADPQSLNSYSYSEGNPIVKSDPSGKYVDIS
jgi:RHS repeat-associated protein